MSEADITGILGLVIGMTAGKKTETLIPVSKSKEKKTEGDIVPYRVEVDYGIPIYGNKKDKDNG